MIAISDSKADGSWDTWITPQNTAPLSAPGQRHFRGAQTLFCDLGIRFVPYDQFMSTRGRSCGGRWNNDNVPH